MTARHTVVTRLVLTIAAVVPLGARDTPAPPAASPQRYEVASIRPCAGEQRPPSQSGGRAAGPGTAVTSPGRARWECVTLDELLQTAYGTPDNRLLNSMPRQMPGEPKIVRGGPAWVYSDKFAIDAKAPGAAERGTLIGPMLRALLEDRFKLKTHRATEERSLYALSVGQGGLKIKPTVPGECREPNPGAPSPDAPPSPGSVPSCGNLHMTWNGGNRRLEYTGVEIHNFAQGALSGLLQRFVLDRTGLSGRYNIAFEFAPDDDTPGNVAALAWARRAGAEPPTAPPIFTALERQVGLKVSTTKAPAEYLVIDSAERPALDAAGRQASLPVSPTQPSAPDRDRAGWLSMMVGALLAVSASPAASILAKVTLTTFLALVAVRLSRRSAAAVRHVLLAAAFGVLLVLPIASVVTPPVPIAVPVPLPETAASPVETAAAFVPEGAADVGNVREAIAPRRSWPAVTLLTSIWSIGALLFLLPIAVGMWLIWSLRRSALPWIEGQAVVNALASDLGIARRVDLVLHESLPGPMTCGVLRPAIVLPVDALRWAAEDLRRAIVHELEHVRRGDWISQSLARAVCACYWFHPLVWIAWRQLALEAERACDDAVLKRSDATAYADQLVGLARRLSTSAKPPLLAMANRHDLAARIVAVLDHRQPRGRAGVAALALAVAAAASIVLTISPITLIADVPVTGQSATDGRKFDVVSIKPCESEPPVAPGARSSQGGFPNISPGRFTFECGTVERLISTAYVQNGEPLVNQAARIGDVHWIKGVPGWVRSDKFTIEARAQGTPDRKEMLGPMLRALLEDRFKLKLHRDTEEVPQYVMTVAKGGLKIKPMGPDGCTAFDRDNPPSRDQMLAANASAKPICGNMQMLRNEGLTRWTLGGDTMERFAGTLSAFMDRHVIDKTGISDTFIIRLEFAADEHVPGPDKRYGPPAEVPQGDGPNIFKALEEQLGLRLDSSRGPHGFLVIDRVERPTPNSPLANFAPTGRARGSSGSR